MCNYCKNKTDNEWIARSNASNTEGVEARIATVDGAAVLMVGGWFDGWSGGAVGIEPQLRAIEYCPMCGRKVQSRC